MSKSLSTSYSILLVLASLLLSSCLPEKFEVKENIQQNGNNAQTDTNNEDDENDSNSASRQLPQVDNFLQQAGTQTLSTLSLFADFNDSFLLRGNGVISYLEEATKSNQTSYCLIANFPGSSGTNAKNVLVLSAKVRSFYSTILNTKEYFFQIEPQNKTINQSDCTTVSLNSSLNSEYGTTNFAYKIDEICPTCNININSESLRVYSPFGNEITDVKSNHLFLNIIPAIGTTNPNVQTCSTNATCTDRGFNCCLSGQCVNHGEVRPEVDQSSDKYTVALNIVNMRPELISNYQDVFYVCPLMVPTDATNNGNNDVDDPTQQASDLFTELTDLYNCLNPVIDEISVCKLDFADASDLMSAGAYTFTVSNDDITFSSINGSLTGNNIAQIDYGGKTYFKEQLFDTDSSVAFDSSYGSFGSRNDNLTQAQSVSLNIPVASDATNDVMSIYFKIDGSCEKLGSSLARCSKTYIQGQSSTPARASDHASGNQIFQIPSYIDTSFNVIVEVGGSTVSPGTETWQLSGNAVVFDSTEYPIFNNQEVKITYFVSTNVSALTEAKELAQDKLDDHCACDPNEPPCNLTPVTTEINGVTTITSYACVYPDPDVPEAPLQETVYISAKSVPHKFFDENGVNYDLGQIGSEFKQEGNVFEYTDGNNLKPNNLDSAVGFNEIYGSMNNDSASPVPPTVVDVDKGTTYDIFIDEGAFSTCLNCGTDYYSSMQKVFPNNFQYKGGGYLPDQVESRRRANQGDYAGDDLLFGRACFVPASMIPWTHVQNDDPTLQRQNRLDAQHFLFANGYNRDWYGFDYGSVIGSFDGVTWFAIGNQRKIKATSNKLYLAVNAYFGDLTINNTFKITINEMANVINSGSLVTSNLENDGAQCQKSHLCDSDEDCITQLGYDYVCQNINSLITPWPQFDNNGNEISGSLQKSLLAINGGNDGEPKRCVYRGRGAICEQNSSSVNINNSYTTSTLTELHHCSPNNICKEFVSNSFNDRISRYAESPKSQNVQSFVTDKSDTFGLAARNLGRPYNYYGDLTADTNIQDQFQETNVRSICVPGKDPENATTLQDSNYLSPNGREADKILNVGRTFSSTISQDPDYFALCPATDEDGDYTHFQNVGLSDSSHAPYAIQNNLSTNSLLLPSFDRLNFFNDDESPVQNIGYHKNTCLRSPGSACFSDFECAPNSFISTKVKALSSVNGEISDAELAFWEEELVCASSRDRYIANSVFPNPEYVTTEHKCCRETNKDFTFFTQKHEGSDIAVVDGSGNPLIPGVNQDIDDPARYSRTHTIYDKLITDPTNYPSMVAAANQPAAQLTLTSATIKQYNTLQLHNGRTCCTGNWIRKLAEGSNGNGGGKVLSPSKLQNIDINSFKPLSWNPNNVPAINTFPDAYDAELVTFRCNIQDYQTSDCEIKNIVDGSNEEERYLNFFGKLELIGIPQVLVETNTSIFKEVATEAMDLDNDGVDEISEQDDISSAQIPLDDTIKDVNDGGVPDANYLGQTYYSASSYDNFEMGSSKLKKVFSEDEFSCCIPTGIELDSSNAPENSACCSGFSATINDQLQCCLEDFTDVSIYTNMYVSSEGANYSGVQVSDSDIDPTSGYIRKELVLEMAKKMCCSGEAAFGIAINDYPIPFGDNTVAPGGVTVRRWLYLETTDDQNGFFGVSNFRDGVRWNNHVYCIPQDVADDLSNSGGSSGSGGGSGNSGSSTLE